MIIISENNKDNTIDQAEAFIKFDKTVVKSKAVNSKLLLIMAYLKINSPLNGNVGISLDLLCRKIGYIPNSRKSKINQQIIDALKLLEKKEAIFIYAKFKDKNEKDIPLVTQKEYKEDDNQIVKKNDCFIVKINNQSSVFNPDDNFVTLYDSEFNSIINSDSQYNKQDMLNVFLNIKKFINFESHSVQLCYPSHTTLCKDCSLSRGAVNNIIGELVKLGVLYTYNSGRFKDTSNKLRYANNFYAVQNNVLKPEICDNMIREYFSSQGLIIEKFIKEKGE